MKKKLLSLGLILVLLLCAACKGSGRDAGSTSVSQQQYTQIPSTSSGTYYVPSTPPSSYSYTPPTKVEMACSICNGTGRRTCSSCHGTGALQKTQYAPSYGLSGGNTSYKIDITCAACSGTGSMSCIYCGGDGKL